MNPACSIAFDDIVNRIAEDANTIFGGIKNVSFATINGKSIFQARREDMVLMHRDVCIPILGSIKQNSSVRVRSLPVRLQYCIAYVPAIASYVWSPNPEFLLDTLYKGDFKNDSAKIDFARIVDKIMASKFKERFGIETYLMAIKQMKHVQVSSFCFFLFQRLPEHMSIIRSDCEDDHLLKTLHLIIANSLTSLEKDKTQDSLCLGFERARYEKFVLDTQLARLGQVIPRVNRRSSIALFSPDA